MKFLDKYVEIQINSRSFSKHNKFEDVENWFICAKMNSILDAFDTSSISILQQNRLIKLYDEKFYLLERTIDETQRTVSISVSSSSKASFYKITFDSNGLVGCSCPDSKFHQNCICKHRCFVYLRLIAVQDKIDYKFFDSSRIPDFSFENFKTSKLFHQNLHFQLLQNIVTHQLDEKEIQNLFRVETLESKQAEDCSICYENFEIQQIDLEKDVKKCPSCENIYHTECIYQWIQSSKKNKTCPLCRSSIWSEFNVKNQR